jgi:hypothetical protein
MPQTQLSHVQPGQPGVAFVWQPSQEPQSLGQAPQSSCGALHLPSPQTVVQGPQSLGQVLQSSPSEASQLSFPHLSPPTITFSQPESGSQQASRTSDQSKY